MDVRGTPRPAAWSRGYRRVRRAVLARRRLLAALCAAGAVLGFLQVRAGPTLVTVPVAARDLPAGVRLRPQDLRQVGLAPGTVPQGVLVAPAGRVLASGARAGEPITDARVVGPGLVPAPGEVVVPVRLADPAVAAQLVPGQAVDVLAVGQDGAALEVAHAALVVAVPRARSAELPGRLVLLSIPSGERDTLVAAAVRDYLTVAFSR